MRAQSLLALFLPILASCGIGSEGYTPPGSAVADGLYTGTTSNGRTMTGLILDDGSFYVLYSVPGNPSLIAGGVQGTGTAANGTYTSSNAKDLNLEGLGLLSASADVKYVTRQSLKGTITYPSLNQTVTLTSTYDARYELTPTLSAIAGNYTGRSGASQYLAEVTTVTISSAGAVSGSGSSGCTFTGTVTPRTKGNAFNTTIKFGPAPCRLPNATLTGVAYFDDATRQLYGLIMTQGRDDGFIFAGGKL